MNQHIVRGGCTNPSFPLRPPHPRRRPTKSLGLLGGVLVIGLFVCLVFAPQLGIDQLLLAASKWLWGSR